jgi:alkaline phosphatase
MILSFVAVAMCAANGCASLDDERAPVGSPETEPLVGTAGIEVRNIVLMIADGAGVGLWTAAKYADDQLAVTRMPVTGLVDTRSAMHKVSDSAAGATVYATGERGMNRTSSVGPAAACPSPQSQRFGGVRDNSEIGQALMEIVRAW